MIAEAKTRFALPIRALAAEMRLGVATLSRWRRRLARGQAPVGRRGPQKVKPLNLSALKEQIQGLGHGGKRSRGSGSLHLVNQVLEEALVIPINSPPYRAAYNGGIEHTQGEFKGYLDRLSWKAGSLDKMALLSETAAHDLNHQPRRSLGGKTACRAYFGGLRIRYPRRRRAAVYAWVHDLAAEVSTRAGKPVITPVAWRVAARQWLVQNGLIRIQKTGEVSPNFYQKSDHN